MHRIEADETDQALSLQQGHQHDRQDRLELKDLALRGPGVRELRHTRNHDGLSGLQNLNRGEEVLDRKLLQMIDHRLDPRSNPLVTVAYGVGNEIESKHVSPIGSGKDAEPLECSVDQRIEILVVDPDEGRGQIEELALERLALDQLELCAFTLGDVLMGTGHAQRPTLRIARRDAALTVNPDPMAVAVQHP